MLSGIFSNPLEVLLQIIAVIISLSIHEFFHAYTAYRLGDPTAKMAGRLTLNPVAHMDLLGLLFILFARFGWAKPVPVNPNNLKGRNDEFWITAAGPLSNLGLASISGLSLKIMASAGILKEDNLLVTFLVSMLFINIILFLFNLIPFHPLDGSKVFLRLFVSETNYEFRNKFIAYGPYLLLGLLILNTLTGGLILSYLFGPFFNFFVGLFF